MYMILVVAAGVCGNLYVYMCVPEPVVCIAIRLDHFLEELRALL